MNQLIKEIDQLLRNDIQSISQGKLLIAQLRNNFVNLKYGFDQFNINFTNLRQIHKNTSNSHMEKLRPIVDRIENVKTDIFNIQSRIQNIKDEIKNETCCCDECIRKIIETIYNEVISVINQIIQLIETAELESKNSIGEDQNLLIQYQCINNHLNFIINLCEGLPDLPLQINLLQLRNELTTRINELNTEYKPQFLRQLNQAKTRLQLQNKREISYFSRLRIESIQHLTTICQKVTQINNILLHIRNELLNFILRNRTIKTKLNNLKRRLGLILQNPNNFWIIIQLIIGVLLFFIFDSLFIKN